MNQLLNHYVRLVKAVGAYMVDTVYKNAPLVEVIAEFRWEGMQIATSPIPGAALDPFFSIKHEDFRLEMVKKGFGYIETVNPIGEFPLEMFFGKPVYRYRRELGGWPLFQLGPGIFTCNIAPPYKGWSEFLQYLKQGFEILFQKNGSSFRGVTTQLRYVNAFTSKHGYKGNTEFVDFAKKQLGINVQIDAFSKPDHKDIIVDAYKVDIMCKVTGNSTDMNLNIFASPGIHSNTLEAAIVNFVAMGENISTVTEEEATQWFSSAREKLHSLFEAVLDNSLRDKIGPRETI